MNDHYLYVYDGLDNYFTFYGDQIYFSMEKEKLGYAFKMGRIPTLKEFKEEHIRFELQPGSYLDLIDHIIEHYDSLVNVMEW